MTITDKIIIFFVAPAMIAAVAYLAHTMGIL